MESLAAVDAFILYHYHARPPKHNQENPEMARHFLCKSRRPSPSKIHLIDKTKAGASLKSITSRRLRFLFAGPVASCKTVCSNRCAVCSKYKSIEPKALRRLIFCFFFTLCLLFFRLSFPLSTVFIFALVFNLLLQTANCLLQAVFPLQK